MKSARKIWRQHSHGGPGGLAAVRQQQVPGRLDRVVRSALDRGERTLIDRVCARLPEEVRERLDGLVFGVPDDPMHVDDDGPAYGP